MTVQTMPATEVPVSRPKRMGRPPTSNRDDVAVKIDKTLAAKARYVAATRDISLAEYLSELCRALIDQDFDRATRKGKT